MLIGTHNGYFHADDVTAVCILKWFKEYENAKIIRSRNLDELNKCNIVVDVGFEYDHAKKRYDHHMPTFTVKFDEKHNQTVLSSSGLIWMHYGKELLKEHFNVFEQYKIDKLHILLYDLIFEYLDCIDNGVSLCSCNSLREQFPNKDLIMNVRELNTNDVVQLDQFEKAVNVVNDYLEQIIKYVVSSYDGHIKTMQNIKKLHLFDNYYAYDLTNIYDVCIDVIKYLNTDESVIFCIQDDKLYCDQNEKITYYVNRLLRFGINTNFSNYNFLNLTAASVSDLLADVKNRIKILGQ